MSMHGRSIGSRAAASLQEGKEPLIFMAANGGSGGVAQAELIDGLTAIVSKAAEAIMRIDPATAVRRTKADMSPVSAADEAANEIIITGVRLLMPGVPIISEESVAHGNIPAPGREFVLIDPLDGTKEFLAGRTDFTLNIAIVRDGRPHIGIIGAPAYETVWRGIAGQGAERLRLAAGASPDKARDVTPIHTRRPPLDELIAAVSRSHFDSQTAEFLARHPVAARTGCGSSLKFCRIAEGEVDIYPRLSPTHEWDIAAGHAILAGAGGCVTAPDGEPLAYGRVAQAFRVPAFIAWGTAELAADLKLAGRPC